MSILIQLNLKIDLSHPRLYFSLDYSKCRNKDTQRDFLTSLNEDMALRHDGIEGTDSKWFGINNLLKDYENGKVSLIMPTIKNLESITNFANTDELMSAKKVLTRKIYLQLNPNSSLKMENGEDCCLEGWI